MFDSFHYFRNLPAELQIEIWSSAIRPAEAGVQIFSLTSDYRSQPQDEGALEASWRSSYYLAAPKWAFGRKSSPLDVSNEITASWSKNNPSTYVIDSGVWNACKQSHCIMKDILSPTKPKAIHMKVRCGPSNAEANEPASDTSQPSSVVVSPSQDLFILQIDGPDIFSWSFLEDAMPSNRAKGLLRIPHVGWQYHPSWAASLHVSTWIRSLDSLCCYIVYGVRFGGLETLWLINYRIKRKHWVLSQAESNGPRPKVFRTDNFRLIEVETGDGTRPSEQLSWDEVVEGECDSYPLEDFLAFVGQLRQLVTHTLLSMPALEAVQRTTSIKILACEDL